MAMEKNKLQEELVKIEEEHRLLDEKIRMLQKNKYFTKSEEEEMKKLKFEKLRKKQEIYKLKGLLSKNTSD